MDIRVVLCGDDGVGKSSLITSLVKATFVPRIQRIVPAITIPPYPLSAQTVNTTIVDTSSEPDERDNLTCEIRKADVICLVYSDNYSCERISLFWLPFFRSCGVNLPIILCANKVEDSSPDNIQARVHGEMLPIMQEFKEIEACLCCSAKTNFNVNELFYLCNRCVTHPLLPLWDTKDQKLKPLAVKSLTRVFLLSDRNQDGFLDDAELGQLQEECFGKPLPEAELFDIKEAVHKADTSSITAEGISLSGFLTLNKIFLEKGRQETTWQILRAFHYTDSLSLQDAYLHPRFDVGSENRVELSANGFEFLVDLFYRYDRDSDGALNKTELDALFKTTPGIPELWSNYKFPDCTVTNESGFVTYNGWLAQWSMMALLDHKQTLEYLAYLGFNRGIKGNLTDALHVIKVKRYSKRIRSSKTERNCILCYVIGSYGCGKSALLQSFLGKTQFEHTVDSDGGLRVAVNSIEAGEKQRYLILKEINDVHQLSTDTVEFAQPCDALCLLYDSSDPDSFSYLAGYIEQHPELKSIPMVFAATKADLDRQPQRHIVPPDVFTRELGLATPIHISAKWHTNTNFFVQLAEAGQHSQQYLVKSKDEKREPINLKLLVAVCSFSSLVIAISTHLLVRLYSQSTFRK